MNPHVQTIADDVIDSILMDHRVDDTPLAEALLALAAGGMIGISEETERTLREIIKEGN